MNFVINVALFVNDIQSALHTDFQRVPLGTTSLLIICNHFLK